SAAKGGLIPERLGVLFPRVAAIPFSSAQQFMATLHRHPDGGLLVVAKGGAERLLNLCGSQFGGGDPNQRLDHQQVMEAVEGLTGGGSRVLAAAVGWIERPEQFSRHQLTGRLSLVGLQAMADPLRPEAAAAVHSCLSAGVAVKMITGDHPATAAVIATELGLLQPGTKDHLLTGSQLAALPAAALPAAVDRASVFARVSPEQKLQLVEALQSRGQVVAMTGDGVNDAPALRQADVGVAMGRGGTEVAKDAADVVLLDDDFASIEAAIEEGRGIYDNLVKFIVWTIPTNMGEALVIVAAVLLGASLPVLPVQVLWINMTTAVALGLMLAFEPKEAGLMQRPPRDPSRPLLTGSVLLRTVIVSALLVAGAWWLFEWERTQGASLAAARTTAMNLFVAVEALYLFSCRSLTRGPWSIGFFSNRWVLGGVAVQAVAQAGLTYIPAMNHLFQTAPISLGAWLRIAGAATVTGVVVALLKRLRGLSP
ncbi:MAG: HAD-IC family P-type ATPase, partial [Candidatus Dormiibacterota bacterium]